MDALDYVPHSQALVDFGPALNLAIDYARPGDCLTIPTCRIATPVIVNKPVDIVGGRGAVVTVAGGIAAFKLPQMDTRVIGLKIVGDRTPGQTGIWIDAPEVVVEDTKIHLVDKGIHQTKGFHAKLDGLRMRNIRDAVILLEGTTVGTTIRDLKYFTDTPQFGGVYDEPLTGGLVIRCEGVMLSDSDIIVAGDGIVIEAPATRDVYWCKIMNSFVDTCGRSGILIRNTQPGRRIMGIFFDAVWSATNQRGLVIDGDQPIDGVKFSSGPIHNNLNEGVRIANPAARNIRFSNCDISGNSRSGAGTANNAAVPFGSARFSNCNFKRQFTWATTPYCHLFVGAGAGEQIVDGCEFDEHVTQVKVFDPSGHIAAGSVNYGL